MPRVHIEPELMRKIHALLKASRHDPQLPHFPNEEVLVELAVRKYLAENAIIEYSGLHGGMLDR